MSHFMMNFSRRGHFFSFWAKGIAKSPGGGRLLTGVWRGAGEDHVAESHPRQFLAVYSPRPNPNSNPPPFPHAAPVSSSSPFHRSSAPCSPWPPPRGAATVRRAQDPARQGVGGGHAVAFQNPGKRATPTRPEPPPRSRGSCTGFLRTDRSYQDFSNPTTALRPHSLTDILC
jgi:hypothetical protein